MKMELLRNCAHGSEIATYLAMDEIGRKRIIKASTTPSGIENLLNEVAGWHWYQALRCPSNEPFCKIAQKRDSYLQIHIKYIGGDKPVYQNGLEQNAAVIRKIVQHYCHIWPQSSGVSPMHGDLSLDNIIINDDGVHIIDWEHFIADAAPWGFDILYLLFESLYFGMRDRRKPTENEIQIICENIKTMDDHRLLHPDMLRVPLRFTKDFILENRHLWGEQLVSFHMKLPIVAFTAEQVTVIDEMLNLGIA